MMFQKKSSAVSIWVERLMPYDPQRCLLLSYRPEGEQHILAAVFCLAVEIEKLIAKASQVVLAQMKLQWWIDTLESDNLFPKDHRLSDVLFFLIQTTPITKQDIVPLLVAYQNTLEHEFVVPSTADFIDRHRPVSLALSSLLQIWVKDRHPLVVEKTALIMDALMLMWNCSLTLQKLPERWGSGHQDIPFSFLDAAGVDPLKPLSHLLKQYNARMSKAFRCFASDVFRTSDAKVIQSHSFPSSLKFFEQSRQQLLFTFKVFRHTRQVPVPIASLKMPWFMRVFG